MFYNLKECNLIGPFFVYALGFINTYLYKKNFSVSGLVKKTFKASYLKKRFSFLQIK